MQEKIQPKQQQSKRSSKSNKKTPTKEKERSKNNDLKSLNMQLVIRFFYSLLSSFLLVQPAC